MKRVKSLLRRKSSSGSAPSAPAPFPTAAAPPCILHASAGTAGHTMRIVAEPPTPVSERLSGFGSDTSSCYSPTDESGGARLALPGGRRPGTVWTAPGTTGGTNLHRTRSRSVECLKRPQNRRTILREMLFRGKTEDEGSEKGSSRGGGGDSRGGSEADLADLAFHSTRRLSHHAGLRSRQQNSLDSSRSSIPSQRASARANLQGRYGRGDKGANGSPLHVVSQQDGRHRSSVTSLYHPGHPGLAGRSTGLSGQASAAAADPTLLRSLPRLKSEENLILNLHRQKEVSWMRSSHFKDEANVLQNIQKRELIEQKKKETKTPLDTNKEKEKKRRHLFFSDDSPIAPAPPPSDQKTIATGLFKTRTILLAPTARPEQLMMLNPASPVLEQQQDERKPGPKRKLTAKEKMEMWVPPPQQKPQERQLVRKVASACLYNSPKQMTTNFVESDFVQSCLDAHNVCREMHSAPPLMLDERLCASSQYWANILAHKDAFYHQNPSEVGENLFAWPLPILPESVLARHCPDVTGEDVTNYWYKTLREYYFLKDPDMLHAHAAQFSQMVWVSSERFGCGKARSKSGKVIVVAHYLPKGNVVGQFEENVLPPKMCLAEDGQGHCHGQGQGQGHGHGQGHEDHEEEGSRSSSTDGTGEQGQSRISSISI